MKKLLTSLFLFLFLFSVAVSANSPDLPYTIDGKASLTTGECVTGFDINVKAMDYSSFPFVEKEFDVTVNENCEYNFALGNQPLIKWMVGMEITLLFCNKELNPNCEKVLTIGQGGCEKGGGCTLDFTLQSTDMVSTPSGDVPASEVIREIECWDGSVVNNVADCPEQPEDEPSKDIYDYLYILAGVILTALGLAGFIKGLVPYWYNKGVKLMAEGKRLKDNEMIEKGKACKTRAIKMMTTAMKKAAEGKYGR